MNSETVFLSASPDSLRAAVNTLYKESHGLGFKYLSFTSFTGIFETEVGDIFLEFSDLDQPSSVRIDIKYRQGTNVERASSDLSWLTDWIEEFGMTATSESGQPCNLAEAWHMVSVDSRK